MRWASVLCDVRDTGRRGMEAGVRWMKEEEKGTTRVGQKGQHTFYGYMSDRINDDFKIQMPK